MGLASFWDAKVVPRIVRCGCSQAPIMAIRRQVVPLAEGRVLEVGCGGGLNQPLYDPARISAYAGIDPSPELLDFARAEAGRKGWSADIRQGVAEDLPFAEASFDTVVCTFTLCSVADHARSLAELRRVLRPGGRLLYAEHGRAPDPAVARWQDRLDPLWHRVFGNCHLGRPVGGAIDAAGFELHPLASGYQRPAPRFAGWMEWGVAIRAS